MKSITLFWLVAFCLFSTSASHSQQPVKVEMETDFAQRLDAWFRMFKTMNLYNYILLGTRTGRMVGVQCLFGEKAETGTGWFTISDKSLVSDEKENKDGKFTLVKTMNLYTYILLDQENGKMWRFQYSITDAEKTRLIPITEWHADK